MKGPLLSSALALILLAGCSKTNPEPGNTPSADVAAATTPPAKAPSTGKGVAQLDPTKATEKAPDLFKAKFTTTKGDFVIEVHRDWSPNGADRFYNLVKMGFYDDTRFFRTIDGFMVQFGINGDPAVSAKWQTARFPDDPVKQSNKPGFVSFATMGPNSRTTQVFISYGDNARLDSMGFTPFGQVNAEGMAVLNSLYKGYGEGAPGGMGPSQGRIQSEGNAYLDKAFPKLDRVKEATIVP